MDYPNRIDFIQLETKTYEVLQALQNNESETAKKVIIDELLPMIKSQRKILIEWNDIFWNISNKLSI